MSDKFYNIAIVDRRGETKRLRGVPADELKDREKALRKEANEEGFEPPLHFIKHEVK